MLTLRERQPLKHLQGSKRSLAAGAFLFAAGVFLLFFGGSGATGLAGIAMGIGLAVALASAYYWGCGNEGCTPPDV